MNITYRNLRAIGLLYAGRFVTDTWNNSESTIAYTLFYLFPIYRLNGSKILKVLQCTKRHAMDVVPLEYQWMQYNRGKTPPWLVVEETGHARYRYLIL